MESSEVAGHQAMVILKAAQRSIEDAASAMFKQHQPHTSRAGDLPMMVFVFPGQGSQRHGMGQDLFDKQKEFTELEREIDSILGYSVRRMCLENPDNCLKDTRYTQPCLYVVNALHYYQAISSGEKPAFVAGHSVGEYNALLAAGAFDFLTGLKLVQKRGELMAAVKNGGMAAVAGLSVEKIQRTLQEGGLTGLDMANYNSPSQVVLSGPKDEILRGAPGFEKAGARLYFPLPVSAAFHSRYMAGVAESFADFLASFSFSPLQVPLISNVTAQPYPSGNPSFTIKTLLVRQISHPVLWMQSIRYLLQRGATHFKELGPGTVLTKLIGETRKEVEQLYAASAS